MQRRRPARPGFGRLPPESSDRHGAHRSDSATSLIGVEAQRHRFTARQTSACADYRLIGPSNPVAPVTERFGVRLQDVTPLALLDGLDTQTLRTSWSPCGHWSRKAGTRRRYPRAAGTLPLSASRSQYWPSGSPYVPQPVARKSPLADATVEVPRAFPWWRQRPRPASPKARIWLKHWTPRDGARGLEPPDLWVRCTRSGRDFSVRSGAFAGTIVWRSTPSPKRISGDSPGIPVDSGTLGVECLNGEAGGSLLGAL
jgi:hypothetical protein